MADIEAFQHDVPAGTRLSMRAGSIMTEPAEMA